MAAASKRAQWRYLRATTSSSLFLTSKIELLHEPILGESRHVCFGSQAALRFYSSPTAALGRIADVFPEISKK